MNRYLSSPSYVELQKLAQKGHSKIMAERLKRSQLMPYLYARLIDELFYTSNLQKSANIADLLLAKIPSIEQFEDDLVKKVIRVSRQKVKHVGFWLDFLDKRNILVDKKRCLISAIDNGNYEAVRWLHEKGVDVTGTGRKTNLKLYLHQCNFKSSEPHSEMVYLLSGEANLRQTLEETLPQGLSVVKKHKL